MAKILVVDDEEDILFLLERTLSQAGHHVLSASDPRRVLPLARSGRFDAIVLDVMMPEISGWSLLVQLREQVETRTTPVVFLTARSALADRVRGLRIGADDYLTKPFEPAELIARIEGLIERRAPRAAALQGQLQVQSVQEVLQQLDQGQKSGRLELLAGALSGEIWLDQGAVVKAHQGRLEGEEAILALLDLSAGSFLFEPRTLDEPTALRLVVPPLLIRAAWLDDELNKRSHHLPASAAPLTLSHPPPASPDDLPALPLELLTRVFWDNSNPTLRDLLRLPVSGKRLKLALAWLIELGCVTVGESVPSAAPAAQDWAPTATDPTAAPSPNPASLAPTPPSASEPTRSAVAATREPAVAVVEPAAQPVERAAEPVAQPEPGHAENSDDEALEALDMALRELLQAVHFRGLPLDSVQVDLLVDPSRWDQALDLVRSLPATLAVEAPAGDPAPGSSLLRHPVGNLTLAWHPLTPGDPASALGGLAKQSAGVVLWFGESSHEADLASLGATLRRRAPRAGLALVAPELDLLERGRRHFADDPRWRLLPTAPADLGELLLELTFADPYEEGQG